MKERHGKGEKQKAAYIYELCAMLWSIIHSFSMRKFYSVFFVLLMAVIISSAQNKENKQLAKNLDKLLSENYKSIAPGCVVLVAKNGDVIYNKAFGLANLELNVPMQPEMIFRIGSITKQFTAIAILQLMERGKISLNDSLQKFIKDFPYKGHTITVEHLLTHTSGIVGYDALDFHIPSAYRVEFSQKRIIDSLRSVPLGFAPGSKYHYSNSNYFILAYIIELVSGKLYKDYLQENLFRRVGLSQMYYNNPMALVPNRVSGYAKDSGTFWNSDYTSMSSVYGAGALLSNTMDLFKWHKALYAYKLVRKETLKKALTPFKLSNGQLSEYGYGWFIKDLQGGKSIGHGGAIDGFRSMALYLPAQDMFVAALFNSDDDAFLDLFDKTVSTAMGTAIPAFKDLPLNDSIINRYIGTYKFVTANADSADALRVYKEKNRLYLDISNGSGTHLGLAAQSETKFILTIRRPTTVEFVIENGKVTKLIWTQQNSYVVPKVE